jgi:3-dehydroquinate synthase II
MKKFWFKINEWQPELVTTALETGFDTIYVPEGYVDKVKELARIQVLSTDNQADLVLGKSVAEIVIDSQDRESEVEKYRGKIPVILRTPDWKIIPLENLIAKTNNLIQSVHTCEQARIALETLERGADGILLETDEIAEVKKFSQLIKVIQNEKLSLVEAEIISTEAVGMGDRVIVDTSTLLQPGQGMLVGHSSAAMFLVFNENVENPYCDPRPFRVNAGGVHAYIRITDNQTKYLSELKSGYKVLIVNPSGNTEAAIVGRVKIEKRPMLLVRGQVENREVSLILQNAETIRLTQPSGDYISVTHLQPGAKVLAFVQEPGVGRHFGREIQETITEK